MLRVAGIHLPDGQCFDIDGIGFAETKGFCGGFTPYELMPFGEQGIKTLVEIAEREAIKLDYGLAQTHAEKKVAITHYSPIKETMVGEPEPIFLFLGSRVSSTRSKRTGRYSRSTAMRRKARFLLKRSPEFACATFRYHSAPARRRAPVGDFQSLGFI